MDTWCRHLCVNVATLIASFIAARDRCFYGRAWIPPRFSNSYYYVNIIHPMRVESLDSSNPKENEPGEIKIG